MALDAHIIAADGTVDQNRFAEIGVDAHAELCRDIGDQGQFPMLSRLRDYYADATYGPDEVASLAGEVDRAAEQLPSGHSARKFLETLRERCGDAASKGAGIVLYAD